MNFNQKLIKGILIKRIKNFLAEVQVGDKVVTVHCPNTGSMIGCSEPGSIVYISESDNIKRKYLYTWELTKVKETLIGINTQNPNHIVYEAIQSGKVHELSGYSVVRREVPYKSSRIDMYLEHKNSTYKPCFLEVKNVTLKQGNGATFPDAVTKRGLKHLQDLNYIHNKGFESIIFYLVQRDDCSYFTTSDNIDIEYGKTFREVQAKGVIPLAYQCKVSVQCIDIDNSLPVKVENFI